MANIEPIITAYISPLERGVVRDACAPYLQELALVIVAWNELHMELSQLFCTVAGFPNMLTGLNVWHSTENDRAQRKMLREALSSGLQHLPRIKEKGEKFLDCARKDIEFLLNKVDAISDDRNNAVHSPYMFSINRKDITMQSFDFFMSPRAKKLVGKDLLVEFRRQTEWAMSLSAFSQNLRLGLYLVPDPGWPQRPPRPENSTARPRKC